MNQLAEPAQRMNSLDASFLYLEQPNALLHIGGIYTFAHPLNYGRLLSYVRDRLPLVPRYLQRAVMVPLHLAHPTWEPDPGFDIRHHVLRHRLKGAAPDAALAALCAELFAEPLDRARPLWEMHLIEGYGHGCALLAKAHHCLIDSVSGVQLLNILMDPSPKPRLVEPPPPRLAAPLMPPLLSAANGLLDTARAQWRGSRQLVRTLRHPAHALQELRATLDAVGALVRTLLTSAPPMPFNGAIGRQRTLAWTRCSLNEVKSIKNRLGGTVDDVILAVIAGGLGSYLRDHTVRVERTALKAMVPVPVRAEHEYLKLGNRVSMLVAPLPIGTTDPVERLRQVSAAMDSLKSSGHTNQVERIIALTDFLPPVLQGPLARLQASASAVNTVCTNVPGPRETRYLLGEPVQMIVPLAPLAAGIGLGFAITSYADQLTVGLNADAERVPDIDRLATALQESFEELWTATGLERPPQRAADDLHAAVDGAAGKRQRPGTKRRARGSRAARPSRASEAAGSGA
jgi:diacylglycerol O-acyltransferase